MTHQDEFTTPRGGLRHLSGRLLSPTAQFSTPQMDGTNPTSAQRVTKDQEEEISVDQMSTQDKLSCREKEAYVPTITTITTLTTQIPYPQNLQASNRQPTKINCEIIHTK